MLSWNLTPSVFYLAKFPKTHLHFNKGGDPVLLKSTTRYEGASVPMIVSVKLDEVEMCPNAAAGNICCPCWARILSKEVSPYF